MPDTAQNVIRNLIDDVNNLGFVPNGARIYYLDRSQPPLLSEMVRSYTAYLFQKDQKRIQMHKKEQSNRKEQEQQGVKLDPDISAPEISDELYTFLREAYGALQKEYDWWMNPDNGHAVLLTADQADRVAPTSSLRRYSRRRCI